VGCRPHERALITESAADFAAALPEGGALLGLDLGTRTIGTATCDAGWRFATNRSTIARGKWSRDRAALSDMIAARAICGIVLGLPRNMDGSEGPRAQSSRAFAQNLTEAFALPLLLWDERWSTQAAEAAMIGQDMSRAKRAKVIDAHAAAVILQGAIDRLAGGVL
jgi:putative Holliday junction resolvase